MRAREGGTSRPVVFKASLGRFSGSGFRVNPQTRRSSLDSPALGLLLPLLCDSLQEIYCLQERLQAVAITSANGAFS